MRRSSRCLRCGEHNAVAGGWQCAECAATFANWKDRDWRASVALLEEQSRWLGKTADRLDGAGFWASARAVTKAQEAVERLATAIDQRLADAEGPPER